MVGVRAWIVPGPWKSLRLYHRPLDNPLGCPHYPHHYCFYMDTQDEEQERWEQELD